MSRIKIPIKIPSRIRRIRKAFQLAEDRRCQLPSCDKLLDMDSAQRHHWRFRGNEHLPWDNEYVHLLCDNCHEKVHIIAAVLVAMLEIEKAVSESVLITSALEEIEKYNEHIISTIDAEFVLRSELEPAGIAKVRNETASLTPSGKVLSGRIRNYLRFCATNTDKEKLQNKAAKQHF